MSQCKRFQKMISAFGLAVAVALPAMLTGDAEAASRVRKNFKDLTALERQRFVDACIMLKAIDPGATNASLLGWDDFVKDHANNMPSAHQASAFLAWHREFLLRLEDALRATHVDHADVTIPYWDWTEDVGYPAALAAFMGGDGVGAGNVVMDGPFAHSTGNWNILIGPVGGPELRRDFQGSSLPTAANVSAALALPAFDITPWNVSSGTSSFRNVLEGWVGPNIHNKVHVWIGQNMATSASPNDPLFFLHHANVDRIWCQWQEAHPFEFHHLPTGPAPCFKLTGETTASAGHNACDAMQPFGSTRPVDMLNPKQLDYQYDDCEGPCTFIDGPWQGLTLSQAMILDGL